MLIGTYDHSFDAKGRVFIPAKWRETVGELIVVTEGILGAKGVCCLFGMSQQEWDAGQAVKRRLYATAAACETDKQGRILIPQSLREYANLAKDAMLVGVGNRVEIWNPADFMRHTELTTAEYDAALAHLAQIGI